MARQMRGTIKCTRTDKGFGFILDESGIERFFHRSHVAPDSVVTFDQMQEGDAVSFYPEEHPKGPRATKVMV